MRGILGHLRETADMGTGGDAGYYVCIHEADALDAATRSTKGHAMTPRELRDRAIYKLRLQGDALDAIYFWFCVGLAVWMVRGI